MPIVVMGLNYRTAPIEIREKLTLSGCALQSALEELKRLLLAQTQGVYEAVILSTCNRLEVIVSTPHVEDAIALVEQFLSRVSHADLSPHLYSHVGDEASRHLMRVACGLDSMILGESEILGQVTGAFEDARSAGTIGTVLSRLFAHAIHTGKRARTETPISRYTTSVSHVAARRVMEKLNPLQPAKLLIVGVGKMAMLAAQALKRFDMTDLMFLNRTFERADWLATDFGGQAVHWLQLREALVWADAIICATGAPQPVITRHDLESVLDRRQGRPLVIMDIAVPRDVESTIRELPGVQYDDIDDLQSVVDANIELRRAAIPQVEAVIEQEIERFTDWIRSRQVVPVIKQLREQAQIIADEELTHTLSRLPDADERTRQLITLMAHRLVNRLMHEPTSRLREQAAQGKGDLYADAVRELFALNDEPEIAQSVASAHDLPYVMFSGSEHCL